MQTNIKKEISVTCPWCNKGKIKADRIAEVNLSCRCTVCGNFYRVNLKSLRAFKSRASPANKVFK